MKTLIKNSLYVIAACCFCLASCKKENTTNSNDNAAQFSTGIKSLINANQPRKLTTTISADLGATLIGANTRFVFYPNAFKDANGATVTGNVNLEIQEFYTKGQMILSNKVPMSTQGLLESRGEVYINATKNGQPLRLKTGYAQISFEGKAFNQPMALFTGTVSGDLNDINWTQNMVVTPVNAFQGCSYDSVNPPQFIDSLATAAICDTLHTFPLDSFGWINCDYFMRNTYGTLTNLTINVPSGYDNTNTRVYVVFTTINSVASVYSYTNGAFLLSGGYQVPVGLQATIVALAYNNGQWYSSFTPITITNNHVATLSFSPTTIAAYTAQVSAL